MTPNPATVSIKDKVQFLIQVNGTPAGQDAGVVWSVPAGSGASIDQNGLLTTPTNPTPANQPIIVTVTSKYYPAYSVQIPVTVQDNSAVIVTPNPASVAFRTTQKFTAEVTGLPTGGVSTVKWSVNDTSIGTIDASGNFTAKGKKGPGHRHRDQRLLRQDRDGDGQRRHGDNQHRG